MTEPTDVCLACLLLQSLLDAWSQALHANPPRPTHFPEHWSSARKRLNRLGHRLLQKPPLTLTQQGHLWLTAPFLFMAGIELTADFAPQPATLTGVLFTLNHGLMAVWLGRRLWHWVRPIVLTIALLLAIAAMLGVVWLVVQGSAPR